MYGWHTSLLSTGEPHLLPKFHRLVLLQSMGRYLLMATCPTLLLAPFVQIPTSFDCSRAWGTLLAGLPTVYQAILLGRRIFEKNPLLSLMLPLLVIAHPQLVFTQSYTNTDALVTTLSSLSIYLCVLFIQGKTSILRALVIGFTLGLAVLTKTNSICLVPAVAWGNLDGLPLA